MAIVMETFGGHLYLLQTVRIGAMTWHSADARSAGIEDGATDWHLVSIASRAENRVAATLGAVAGGAWIGLVQTPGSSEPSGGWTWTDGTPLSFENWATGEPNNAAGEGFGQIYPNGLWNDLSAWRGLTGAVYELDTARAVRLHGSTDADVLFGGAFEDRLVGGDGDDVLTGGRARDVLLGGMGADRFVYLTRLDSVRGDADVVADFQSGADTLDLSALDADPTTPDDDAFSFIADGLFTGTAGELRMAVTDSGVTRLLGDLSGDGQPDFAIRVHSLTVLQGDLIL